MPYPPRVSRCLHLPPAGQGPAEERALGAWGRGWHGPRGMLLASGHLALPLGHVSPDPIPMAPLPAPWFSLGHPARLLPCRESQPLQPHLDPFWVFGAEKGGEQGRGAGAVTLGSVPLPAELGAIFLGATKTASTPSAWGTPAILVGAMGPVCGLVPSPDPIFSLPPAPLMAASLLGGRRRRSGRPSGSRRAG